MKRFRRVKIGDEHEGHQRQSFVSIHRKIDQVENLKKIKMSLIDYYA